MKKHLYFTTLLGSMMLVLFLAFASNTAFAGSINAPVLVAPGNEVTATLSEDDYNHYYKIDLATSGTLKVDYAKRKDYSYVSVLDASHNILFAEKGHTSEKAGTISLEVPKGSYYIAFEGGIPSWLKNDNGSYSFTPYFESAKSSFENNTSFDTAAKMKSGKVYKGHLGVNNNMDYFKIYMSAKGKFSLKTTVESTYGFVNIYNAKKQLVKEITIRKNESNGISEVMLTAKKGTYYVEVISYRKGIANNKYGKFTLKARTYPTPKKVTITSVKAGKQKMTIKWKKAENAVGYQIVYAPNKNFSKGKKVVNVTSKKAVERTIKKLKSKKTYYVKVRAYNKAGGTKLYGLYGPVKKVKVK